MELLKHWKEIVSVVLAGQKSSIHCSVASVDSNGLPNVTPIGTVFLRDNATGYYFDTFTSQLAKNIETNPNICLMAVDTKSSYWFKSLLKGRFATPPGVRLYGTVGELREATAAEKQTIEKRIKPTRWMKGSQLIWSDFTHVRDIQFTHFRPVQYPKMMAHLWND
jgi:uncharacterized pyridoxamine 5'-phosphate oxidase family protein